MIRSRRMRMTRKGGVRMRPKKTLKRIGKPKVNVIGIEKKTTKKKNIFANLGNENIKNIILLDPIEYLQRAKIFLEALSDSANKALASGQQSRYSRYISIANVIAEAVVDTFKKHSKLLKDETDELADLLMSTTMSGNAKNIKEDFAELMDESRIFEEPLDYIDDLAEYIDDFIDMYDDIIKTNSSMKSKLNPMGEFATHLSDDLRSAIEFARDHFTEQRSVSIANNNAKMNNGANNTSAKNNYSSVNSTSVANNRNGNTNANAQVNNLATLFESTFTKAFGKV